MVGGNILKTTKVPIPGKHESETTPPSKKYRPSGWAPLAYPLSAFQIPVESEFENSVALSNIHSEDTESNPRSQYRGNENPYFPVHKQILFVLIRDLMVVDGVLDPKTYELIRAKNGKDSNFSRHWCPDWRKIRKASQEELDLKRPLSTNDVRDRRTKRLKTCQDKKFVEARTPSSQTLLGECKESPHFLSKIKKDSKNDSDSFTQNKHSREDKGISEELISFMPASTCNPDDVTSMSVSPPNTRNEFDPNKEIIIIEDYDSENDNLPTYAEELAAVIAKRAIMEKKSNDICEDLIPGLISATLDCSRKSRSRTVSDTDLLASQVDSRSSVSTLKSSISDGRTFPCVQYSSKEELLHVSIYHEECLRVTGYEMVKRVVESFSTYTLRKLLSYRSNSIPRDKMIHLISALVFNASHAMYAWQQTERELLSKSREQWLSVTMKRSRREELDKRIRCLLFNERDLRKVGGFETSSILPSALLMSRLSERKMSWARFAKTGLGRKMLKERGGGGCNYKVSAGWVGAWRKMKYASFDGGTKHIKVEPEISDNESGIVLPNDSCSNSLSSLVSLNLSRPNNEKSWGVKLAREGEMCVVMKVSVDVKSFDLKEGDIIVDVQNDLEKHICAPYYSRRGRFDRDFFDLSNVPTAQQEEERDLRKWFKDVVSIFKSSKKLDLKVTRVGTVKVE